MGPARDVDVAEGGAPTPDPKRRIQRNEVTSRQHGSQSECVKLSPVFGVYTQGAQMGGARGGGVSRV